MTSDFEKNLLGLDIQELTSLVKQAGQPTYRGRQLFHAIYADRIGSLEQASTLPNEFRSWMVADERVIAHPVIEQKFVSTDGTVRYLMRLLDGNTVEAVWMPEGDDGAAGDGSKAEEGDNRDRRRATVCVSRRVDCAVTCQICLTAQLGLPRKR